MMTMIVMCRLSHRLSVQRHSLPHAHRAGASAVVYADRPAYTHGIACVSRFVNGLRFNVMYIMRSRPHPRPLSTILGGSPGRLGPLAREAGRQNARSCRPFTLCPCEGDSAC